MRATILPTAGLVVALTLAGCTDTGDPTVAEQTETRDWSDVPYVAMESRLPRTLGELYVIMDSAGGDSAGLLVERGDESTDFDLQVGEPHTALGYTFELLHVEEGRARLGITDPSGDPISD